jgi:spore germination protein KC
MKKAVFIFLCALLPLLGGCSSSNELSTLALCSSVLYDVGPSGKVAITLEVLDPSSMGGGKESGGGQSASCLHLKGEGDTSSDALRQIAMSFERKLYYPHITARVITEDYARIKLEKSIDFLLRDNEVREGAMLIVVKGENADKLYKASTGLADTVAGYIEDMKSSQPYMTGTAVFTDTIAFIRSYYLDGKEPVAGVLELQKVEDGEQEPGSHGNQTGTGQSAPSESEKYKIRYAGLAVFREARLVGFLNDSEARAYNIITNQIKTAIASIPFPDGYVDVQTTRSKADVKTEIRDGLAYVTIKVNCTLFVRGVQGTENMEDFAAQKQVEEMFNEIIKGEIEATIAKVQNEYHSDIFGFGQMVHAQHPRDWNTMKDGWNDWFDQAVVRVEVQSSIDRAGKIKEPFQMEE